MKQEEMKASLYTTLISLYISLTARRGLAFPAIKPWHPLDEDDHLHPLQDLFMLTKHLG